MRHLLALAALTATACDTGADYNLNFVANPTSPDEVEALIRAHVARLQRFEDNPKYPNPVWYLADGTQTSGTTAGLELSFRYSYDNNNHFIPRKFDERAGNAVQRADTFINLIFPTLTSVRTATQAELAAVDSSNNWREGVVYRVPYRRSIAVDGTYGGEAVKLVVVWGPRFPNEKFANSGWAEKAEDIIDLQAILLPMDCELDTILADAGWYRSVPVVAAILANNIQIGHWAEPL